MNRTEVINNLINQRNSKKYLEIGVYNEQHNFAHINCAYKVGVDIKPITTFCGTSDDFFAYNQEKFGTIFIDGLHTEEQTIKDITNACNCLTNGGVIILHDCMPPDAWHQREPEEFRDGEEWNGTVWKAVLRVFNQSRHRCILLDTDWGCGIIDTYHNQVPLNLTLDSDLNYDQHYPLLLKYKTTAADYLQEQVKVFYHLASMRNWQEVFTEQMQQLKQNGFNTINLTMLGSEEDLKVMDQISEKLNVTVNLLFKNPDLTLYEQPAMLAIEEFARQNEGFVLYLHSKGVSDPDSSTKINWRHLMMQELVENRVYCLQQLLYHDIIGVDWRDNPPHFSGNFWYASTSYLRTLKDFKEFYEHNSIQFADPFDYHRLTCEFWIGSSEEPPRVLSLVCRNVDFYYCAEEFWEINSRKAS